MPYPKKSVEARTIAFERSRAAKWRRVRWRRHEDLPHGGTLTECWCGEPMGHDWPGRAEGARHPVPGAPPGVPPRVQEKQNRQALQEAGVCPVCLGYPELQEQTGRPFCKACLGMGVFPPPTVAAAERWRKEHFS